MIGWFMMGLALLAMGIAALYLVANATPKAVMDGLKWVFAIAVILLTVFLVARGQFQFLWLAAMAVLPWIQRFRLFNRMRRTMHGPSGGKRSEVRTRHLAMQIDLKSGHMDGEILTGAFEGRMLSSLAEEERSSLWREIEDDEKSRSLLAAYFDRTHGTGWRQHEQGAEQHDQQGEEHYRQQSGPMSREEALDILGLGPKASKEEIRAAHRRLMKQAHPDHGGSDYLAAKINQAKDVLLG